MTHFCLNMDTPGHMYSAPGRQKSTHFPYLDTVQQDYTELREITSYGISGMLYVNIVKFLTQLTALKQNKMGRDTDIGYFITLFHDFYIIESVRLVFQHKFNFPKKKKFIKKIIYQ